MLHWIYYLLLLLILAAGLFATILGLPGLWLMVGAAAMELTARQDVAHSFRVGAGAAKGRFYGIMVKLCIGVVMLFVAMWAALPLGGGTTKPARTVASPTTVMTTAPG